MHLELQRLASQDERIDRLVLVDVSALYAHARGSLPELRLALSSVAEACQRGGRQPVWIVAPASDSEDPLPYALDQRGLSELQRAGMAVLVSEEPLSNLAYEALEPKHAAAAIVTAGLPGRMHDAWVLSGPVRSILDVGTGRLWQQADIGGSEPWTYPHAQAVTERATRQPQPMHLEKVREGLEHRALESVGLPVWLVKGASEHLNDVDERERHLLGVDRPDYQAWQAVRAALLPLPQQEVDTGYICARIDGRKHQLVLLELDVLLDGVWKKTTDLEEAKRLAVELRARHPRRWFGPHVVSLLAWMRQQGLLLPERAVDPAWAAFALNPDCAEDLASLAPGVLALPPRTRAWLADVDRRLEAPRNIERVAVLLPALDRTLGRTLQRAGVASVVEEDLGATLPVLAAVEARGVALAPPTGCPTWMNYYDYLDTEMQKYIASVGAQLGPVDFIRNPIATVKAIEKKLRALPPEERVGRKITLQLERYFEAYAPHLDDVRRGHELGQFQRTHPFLVNIASDDELHATSMPLTSGRIGMRAPGLQGLAKHTVDGKLFRTSLVARSGYVLMGCDFNAFEVRIAADLSGDPVLIAACQHTDAWAELQQVLTPLHLRGPNGRLFTKLGTLSSFYGQTKQGFWKDKVKLTRREADQLYDAIAAGLPEFNKFREEVHGFIDSYGFVETRAGWRRHVFGGNMWSRRRAGFSTLIQGTAADIFRRVLRVLHERLAPLGAFIVHHVHDEVYLEVPEGVVEEAKQILVDVMQTCAFDPLPLMSTVPLYVKQPKVGKTWADLI